MKKKQFLTYDEQIIFLEEKKGLMISDKEYAKRYCLKSGIFHSLTVIKKSLSSRTMISFRREQRLKIYMSCIALIMI